MMTFRRISAGGMGKLIRAYLTENSNFAPEPDEGSPAAVLTKYYGRDARVSWRQDMAPEVAAALGIDMAKPPTPETLDQPGDKFRLYKKTSAQIDGKRGFIGANGDVVAVKGWWDWGLVLEGQNGRVGTSSSGG